MQENYLNLHLNTFQLKNLLDWKLQTERKTGKILKGININFTYFYNEGYQIICKPAKDKDLKLRKIQRVDGTYDKFSHYEELIHEYDNVGFGSTPLDILENKYTLLILFSKLHLNNQNPQIYCYIRMNELDERLIPVTINDNPSIIESDPYIVLFGKPEINESDWLYIAHFIKLHKEAIIKHWNEEIDSIGLLESIGIIN